MSRYRTILVKITTTEYFLIYILYSYTYCDYLYDYVRRAGALRQLCLTVPFKSQASFQSCHRLEE